MTTCSRNARVSSIRTNSEAIFGTTCSIAARNAQANGAVIAAEVVIIRVSDLENYEPVIMMQESADLLVTIQPVHGLPLSVEDDQFLHDDNILYITHLEVQRMIYSTMLRYSNNIMRALSYRMNQDTMENLPKHATKETMKEIVSPA